MNKKIILALGASLLISGLLQAVIVFPGSTGEAPTVTHKAGELDQTFGIGGKVTTPIGDGHDSAKSVVLQSDGKIILAGDSSNGSNNDFAAVRLTTDTDPLTLVGALSDNLGLLA